MLDSTLRARVAPVLDATATPLVRAGVTPGQVTAVGLVVGITACVAAAVEQWPAALVLWLVNRLLDGLDGALARRRDGGSDLGGLLDFLADYVVYGGFVVAVGIAVEEAQVACLVLLAAYLLNNVALLSFASLVEKRGLAFGDERSLRLTGGLTEGTETIVAYSLFCLIPSQAEVVAWVFAAMVLITLGQRVHLASKTLR